MLARTVLRRADRRLARRARVVAGMLAVLITGSVWAAPAYEAQAAPASNPFANTRLYVDPNSHAAATAAALRTSDPAAAQLLDKVARGSTADWFTSAVSTAALPGTVLRRASTIQAAGAVPVFVAYNIPGRDCGSYSGGGATSAANYQAWIRAFASGLRSRAAVILEPDALAQLTCLPAAMQRERLALLRYAVGTLAARPGVAVYLDAGHAGWVSTRTMANRLISAGVANARGFALNVSFFNSTADETAYGTGVSGVLRGKPFVIDTSRNGQGVAAGRAWCNPDGRGLGALPGSRPSTRLIDAYLWVKHPGYSDGTCNGGPVAGQWWPSYASSLAAHASW
jgi:endoglucanase